MNNNVLVPVIPEYITVHLGRPNQSAQNVTVPFADYIKNVASSEIYPTWPESAIRANVLAQITFALNRVYTEYYRSRGYDFQITNSTAYDQSFVYGRDIFENISQIVDEIFNSYIRRRGSTEPLFARYCDGDRVQCNGLSQWGSVALANNGLSAYDIIRYYYGDDVDIVSDAPVGGVGESYPGTSLSLGTFSEDVNLIQRRLNRIARNYPSIPMINDPAGLFSEGTEKAVIEFQRQFDLTPDGIVGSATWYAIARIYAAVKKLSDVDSEGVPPEDATLLFGDRIEEGDTGVAVRELQYLLAFVGSFLQAVRPIAIDGIFGRNTRAAVEDLQAYAGLEQTGVVDERTWNALYRTYRTLLASLPADYYSSSTVPYPGSPLRVGSTGAYVRTLQAYLNRISDVYANIPKLTVDGQFGNATRAAVQAYQRIFGIEPSGVVAAYTWDSIASTYTEVNEGRP